MTQTVDSLASLGLRKLTLKSEYNTEDDDIVRDFYGPCLGVSKTYDRAVGFFRANIYRELGEELLDFVIEGGKVRIVCSPDIPEEDENAAREGYRLRGIRTLAEQEATLVHVLEAMSNDPDKTDCLDMLRLLIERESLDLYVATRPGGIYHRKIGVFRDSFDNVIAFSGSGNETQSAVSVVEDWSNDEEFDVYRSWGDDFERRKTSGKREYLERLFKGGTIRTKVRPLNETERAILERFRSHSSLEDCRPGARRRSSLVSTQSAPVKYHYQREAIEAWEKAGRVGILSMATATGKTLTALFAIRDLVLDGYPILILVPSRVLLDQWRTQLLEFFPGVPLLMAGGGNDWREEPAKRMYVSEIKLPRIILATMHTAASDDFLAFLKQAKNAILVVDEVHRLGSTIHRRILDIPFHAKLGLSATPERLFDKEGSEALAKAFGQSAVFNLPIDASVRLSEDTEKEVPILGHFLSQYNYDFLTVSLAGDEQEEWDSITAEIKRAIARNPNRVENGLMTNMDERLRLLFIKRARIVKGARAKVEAADNAISAKYPADGRWIVYCDDENQMNQVAVRLRQKHPRVAVLEYHSKMLKVDREKALDFFDKHPSIMVSIRCLDEGVDIPAADGAVILASSTNPREYIQRRGRILRKAKGKTCAQIIDTIVLPTATGDDDNSFSIIRSELARAYVFAKSALNQDVTHRLWKVCMQYRVRLETDVDMGLQEEEWEE